MALLGSMLLSSEVIPDVIPLVSADDFYLKAHSIIYRTLVSLYDKSQQADPVMLAEELSRNGELEEVGGADYIASLMDAVPTPTNAAHYAEIVSDKALLRNLISVCNRISRDAYTSGDESREIVDRAEQMIFRVCEKKIRRDVVDMRTVLKETMYRIDHLMEHKQGITGIPSGFSDLDELTAGFHPSQLIIIAGRPSMGKSTFAMNIAERVAVGEKIPVAVFSLEVSSEMFAQNLLCSHARIDAHKMRRGYLSEKEWPRISRAVGDLSDAPIFIDDTPGISLLELRAKARRLKARHDIGLIIIDYLQLMKGPPSENRQQEISAISRGLKALARELNIPVIALSQLSRAPESRESHKPRMSDLRESGSLEQDADVILLLYREEYYRDKKDKERDDDKTEGTAEIIIAKQRNGPTGSIELAFLKQYLRFEPLSIKEPV